KKAARKLHRMTGLFYQHFPTHSPDDMAENGEHRHDHKPSLIGELPRAKNIVPLIFPFLRGNAAERKPYQKDRNEEDYNILDQGLEAGRHEVLGVRSDLHASLLSAFGNTTTGLNFFATSNSMEA